MNIIIKAATLNDLKEVQELNQKLFEKEHEEYDPLSNLDWVFGKEGTKYYQDKISKDNGCVLVAIADNKIIGYLCGGLTKAGAYRRLPTIVAAELETLFVLDEFRSKKIGKKLYDKFIEWCKTKNVNKIMLEASPKNKLAIKFYKNNNFKDYSSVLEADI